jgi:thiol-disulfide isomerase/thioredoxin
MHLKACIPSLAGATDWINGKPDIKPDQPLLVYFWAVSCHVCHQNMPKLQSWREVFMPKGLQMIAIHCPRMKTDVDNERVKAVAAQFGILEPCAIDNMHKIKKAFQNEFWPAYFLFDEDGKLIRRAGGNTGLAILEPVMQEMLA